MEERKWDSNRIIDPAWDTPTRARTQTRARLVQLCILMKFLSYLHGKPDYVSSGVFFGGGSGGIFLSVFPVSTFDSSAFVQTLLLFSAVFDEECTVLSKQSTILSS